MSNRELTNASVQNFKKMETCPKHSGTPVEQWRGDWAGPRGGEGFIIRMRLHAVVGVAHLELI